MADDETVGARVSVTTRSLWRIRLRQDLPRYLLCGAALAGLLASARYAIAPPGAQQERVAASSATQDLAAAQYAQLFARAYLTWEAADPEAHLRALSSFVGPGMEANAGLEPAAAGEQRVLWTALAQERAGAPGTLVYTVAAQTDSDGLVYLSVSVGRAPNGALRLTGYPAIVGAPATAAASAAGRLREVDEPQLRTVVERALRNYLAASGGELAADLARGARVSLPAQPLSLEAIEGIAWAPHSRDTVVALVRAQDARGARYTLAYELELSLLAGRWQVGAIQTNPDT